MRNKVVDEIDQMPENKLAEIYDFLHYFRIGLQKSRDNDKILLKFAGSWSDMPESDFEEFNKEITTRRHSAFTERRDDETRTD
jgi:hypothetical protein